MKVSVYLKKSSAATSNICFRVREKNVDIKVVSPLTVYDKYWDADTLSYKRTAAVPATEQKLSSAMCFWFTLQMYNKFPYMFPYIPKKLETD